MATFSVPGQAGPAAEPILASQTPEGRIASGGPLRGGLAGFLAVLAACALALGASAPCAAQDTPASPAAPGPNAPAAGTLPTLGYTRTLSGSTPEFVSVIVQKDGAATYEGRSLSDPPRSRPFRLSPATTDELFALADSLDDFRAQRLESHHLKVANLGRKTFFYQNGAERYEVEFNYTQQKRAVELMDEFDRIALSEQHVDLIEYGLKYDPLGLPAELSRIKADLGEKALSDPQLLVPSLEQVVSNPRLLHLAQVRAEEILKTFAQRQ